MILPTYNTLHQITYLQYTILITYLQTSLSIRCILDLMILIQLSPKQKLSLLGNVITNLTSQLWAINMKIEQ